MPLREYLCPSCGLLDERLINGEPPESVACRRCKTSADLKRIPSSIALARSTMDNAPVDNLIGRDAEVKWGLLNQRQKQRDKVRVETASQGISATAIGVTGPEAYKPVTPEQKTTRTEVSQAIEASGYGSTLRLPGDPA